MVFWNGLGTYEASHLEPLSVMIWLSGQEQQERAFVAGARRKSKQYFEIALL